MEEKIDINGKEYEYEKLTDEQKYFIEQLKDITYKIERMKFEMHQLEVTRNSFIGLFEKTAK